MKRPLANATRLTASALNAVRRLHVRWVNVSRAVVVSREALPVEVLNVLIGRLR